MLAETYLKGYGPLVGSLILLGLMCVFWLCHQIKCWLKRREESRLELDEQELTAAFLANPEGDLLLSSDHSASGRPRFDDDVTTLRLAASLSPGNGENCDVVLVVIKPGDDAEDGFSSSVADDGDPAYPDAE